MSRSLPSSLTPHIAVFASEDLASLLASNELPPLHQLLENFSPLGQVITRTTTLVPVNHASFSLRFSDLSWIENSCREDEEARASRSIDWIGGRIARKAAGWVADLESKRPGELLGRDSPWWMELKQCVEGNRVPIHGEGWNHPVAVILATTTLAPNPLQAVTNLHSRHVDLPSWVDPNILRYTLIIHPLSRSTLSGDEANALMNATKKQFGLHCHLLTLKMNKPNTPKLLASPPPQLPPRTLLPSTPGPAVAQPLHDAHLDVQLNTLNLSDEDTVSTTRFMRELVNQSLIPWMERSVLEWNETYSSSRRLPSRLFSSTRRLFGSSAPSAASSSAPSTPTSPHGNGSNPFSNHPEALSQHRRLAEFSTFLGDVKFAVPLWETIRKEGKGGSDVLPMLLAPSLTLEAHAAYALAPVTTGAALGGKEGVSVGAAAQLRALAYAIRWERAVQDILSLGGEKWLVWAAGSTEEAPMALLIAQAASMSLRKGAFRISAMWYIFAANRMERSGVKALTMYFLRQARELYLRNPDKQLSPSFGDIEGLRDPTTVLSGILPSIEHALGRLLYTTGDVASAVKLFLGLLRGSVFVAGIPADIDKVLLEDFRIAYQHLQQKGSLPLENGTGTILKLPVPICQASLTRRRFATLSSQGGDPVDSDVATGQALEDLEERWQTFWRASSSYNKEALEKSNSAEVGEKFWVDVVLRNPLDTEISLKDVTIRVKEVGVINCNHADAPEGIEMEMKKEISLAAKELQTFSFFIRASRVVSLELTSISFNFLGLLPMEETLGVRGRRLNDTAAQRETPAYASDVLMRIDVRKSGGRLHAELSSSADHPATVLGVGEIKELTVRITNAGSTVVRDLWAVFGESENTGLVWLDTGDPDSDEDGLPSLITTPNSLLAPLPSHVPLERMHGSELGPDQSFDLPLYVQAHVAKPFDVAILFVFRQDFGSSTFFTTFLRTTIKVEPVLDVVAGVRPLPPQSLGYTLALDIENVGSLGDIHITQVSTISPAWSLASSGSCESSTPLPIIPERQMATLIEPVQRPNNATAFDQRHADFLIHNMQNVLTGQPIGSSPPPPIDLVVTARGKETLTSLRRRSMQYFIQAPRRQRLLQSLQSQFPLIPSASYPYIFPLYTPRDFDILVSWSVPSQGKTGFTLVTGLTLGAQHGILNGLLLGVEQGATNSTGKKTRNMYAETTREREALVTSVRNSSWNLDEDPLVLDVQCSDRVEHDFTTRPASIPITFNIRNTSGTRPTEYVLLLSGDPVPSTLQRFNIPPYVGKLSHRGTIPPLSQASVKARIWIVRPGTYALRGWKLQSRPLSEDGAVPGSSSVAVDFTQDAGVDEKIVVVVDASS
ncbi:hypothetical protein FRB93_005483 [Tulasnella sp. JGI-2019a]|nr:hypothetical protein FRB93_005483 [Tulasnella sp. JGI-2019a]